jgi:hypothetical protein
MMYQSIVGFCSNAAVCEISNITSFRRQLLLHSTKGHLYATVVSSPLLYGFWNLLQGTTTYQTVVGVENVLRAEHNWSILSNLRSFSNIQPPTTVQQ